MPCLSVFEAQDPSWRDQVLPPSVRRRVAVEAGVTPGWWRWVGSEGCVVGIESFGESAPAKVLFEHFGLTASAVADAARALIGP